MPETFASTFGFLSIAFFIDAVLYGAAMTLVLYYYKTFTEDPRKYKLLVALIAILTTIQISTFFVWVYECFINNFGNPLKLNFITPCASTQLLAIYSVAFSSQCFFVSRVWMFSRHNAILTLPILLLALLQISAGIAQTTLSAMGRTFSYLPHTERVTTIQSGAATTCDVSITLALCFLLHGSRTGIKSTDGLLNTLIIYTINRGAVTSLAALFNMILVVWRPSAMIFTIALLPSSQLYVISVIGFLISRECVGDHNYNTSDGLVSLPPGRGLVTVSKSQGASLPTTLEKQLETEGAGGVQDAIATTVRSTHNETPERAADDVSCDVAG